jgi:hypothetical protein
MALTLVATSTTLVLVREKQALARNLKTETKHHDKKYKVASSKEDTTEDGPCPLNKPRQWLERSNTKVQGVEVVVAVSANRKVELSKDAP